MYFGSLCSRCLSFWRRLLRLDAGSREPPELLVPPRALGCSFLSRSIYLSAQSRHCWHKSGHLREYALSEVSLRLQCRHLMEQPIDGSCSSGPWPVSATCFIASNRSRRVFGTV